VAIARRPLDGRRLETAVRPFLTTVPNTC
jgi:hypothetical protein